MVANDSHTVHVSVLLMHICDMPVPVSEAEKFRATSSVFVYAAPVLMVTEPVGAVVSARIAEQPAVVPPFIPIHVQLHGPLPVTDEAVPILQRVEEGADGKD